MTTIKDAHYKIPLNKVIVAFAKLLSHERISANESNSARLEFT